MTSTPTRTKAGWVHTRTPRATRTCGGGVRNGYQTEMGRRHSLMRCFCPTVHPRGVRICSQYWQNPGGASWGPSRCNLFSPACRHWQMARNAGNTWMKTIHGVWTSRRLSVPTSTTQTMELRSSALPWSTLAIQPAMWPVRITSRTCCCSAGRTIWSFWPMRCSRIMSRLKRSLWVRGRWCWRRTSWCHWRRCTLQAKGFRASVDCGVGWCISRISTKNG